MSKRLIGAFLAAVIALPLSLPTAALAQRGDYHWRGDRNNGWDPARHYHSGRYRERRLGRNDRIYRGGDGPDHATAASITQRAGKNYRDALTKLTIW